MKENPDKPALERRRIAEEGSKVLVVDDDPRVVSTARRILEGHGYGVATAADGVEAYAHLKSPDCACLLLDVRLPKINGVELLLLMQAEGIRVPTVVMAGFDDFNTREMKHFAGVVAFLHKPFEASQLLAAVKACVET
jgi:FixJ family two-component response regulator